MNRPFRPGAVRSDGRVQHPDAASGDVELALLSLSVPSGRRSMLFAVNFRIRESRWFISSRRRPFRPQRLPDLSEYPLVLSL